MVSQIKARSLKVIEENKTRKLQKNLMQIAQGEDIGFVYGKGKHKPEIQKFYEEPEECGTRLMEYKECFEIMGKGRNSYSKTDMETTFMRTRVPYKYPE